jgi:hypothetical protein
MFWIENTAQSGLSILVRNYLYVLDGSAISLGLCALLFAASLAFDLVATRMGRQSPFPPVPSALEVNGAGDGRLLVLVRRGRLALGLLALVLVCRLLFDIRPGYAAATAAGAAAGRDAFVVSANAAFQAVEQLWLRLSTVLATVGVLTWLTTPFESALLRRNLPE